MKIITIIVPVYNADKYLVRCINSILEQTFLDWELLLIDDGSTDKSGLICDEYQKFDKRIKVIHKKNSGVSTTRNLGIELAKGEYITFIDSDDWVENDYLEKMYLKIKEMNVPLIITGHVEEKNGVINKVFIEDNEKIYKKKDIQIEFLKHEKFMWTIGDKLYSKSLIGDYRFNINLKIAEDMYFLWNILKKTSEVGYIPLYKYHYDIGASNTMMAPFSSKWIDGIKVRKFIYKDCKNISKKHKMLSKMMYIGEIGVVAKKVLCSSKYNKKRLLKYFQQKIRKNIIYCFLYPNTSVITLRQRFGIIYFSLPYKLCLLGKIFLR